MKKGAALTTRITTRQLEEGTAAVDVAGKIAFTEGTAVLRNTVRDLLEHDNRILLNLAAVDFIDSSGLGELVRKPASIRSGGGLLKIVNPSRTVHELLQITKLDRVLDIEQDEASALNSLRQGPARSRSAS